MGQQQVLLLLLYYHHLYNLLHWRKLLLLETMFHLDLSIGNILFLNDILFYRFLRICQIRSMKREGYYFCQSQFLLYLDLLVDYSLCCSQCSMKRHGHLNTEVLFYLDSLHLFYHSALLNAKNMLFLHNHTELLDHPKPRKVILVSDESNY